MLVNASNKKFGQGKVDLQLAETYYIIYTNLFHQTGDKVHVVNILHRQKVKPRCQKRKKSSKFEWKYLQIC